MYNVFMKNGFFEIHGDIDASKYEWLTYNSKDDYYYFHANPTTRRLFAKQMMKDPECFIEDKDKDYLKNLCFSNPVPFDTSKIVLPKLSDGKKFKNYQIEYLKLMLTHKNYCTFIGPGTGKTLIAIAYLNNAQPHKVLVITPKKVVPQYIDEINKYINYMPDIDVINFEQLLVQQVKLQETHYDCVIIDESHRLKNYTSQSSVIVRSMHVDRMFLFSGTPQDKNRFEVMAQLSLFDARMVPSKSKFIARYFEMDNYWRPTTEKRPDELTELINTVSSGAETEKLLKLPKKNEVIIKVKKPPMYEQLKRDCLYIDNDFKTICDTPGKLAGKLRQVCSGFLCDDTGKIIGTRSEKPKELYKLIENLNRAIIYTQYDMDIRMITPVLDALGRSYVVVNGKTTTKRSEKNIKSFKNKDVEFLVIQSASGNAGLDLQVTNNVVFYGLPQSFINFEQCQFRTRRLGQEEEVCNYYYLLCAGTVDMHIMRLLSQKKNFSARLYSNYKIPEAIREQIRLQQN